MSPAQREGGKHILSAAQGKEGGADVLALTLGNSEITEGSQPAWVLTRDKAPCEVLSKNGFTDSSEQALQLRRTVIYPQLPEGNRRLRELDC